MTYQRKTKPAPWLTAFPCQVKNPQVPGRADLALRRQRKRSRKEQYSIAAMAFIERANRGGLVCPVTKQHITQVHHARGRLGKLLLDERFWLGVSAVGHRWIHDHPEEARKRGWLAPPGQWNKSL